MSLAWALLMQPAALAQSTAQDQEYRDPDLDRQEAGELSVSGGFESEWHEFQDLDFRTLDETSDQAVLFSDDRHSFAFTGAYLDLGYQVEPRTRVAFSVSHRGLWGSDQLGASNALSGTFYFSALYAEHAFSTQEGAPKLRVGREFFSIGGLAGAQDYALADVLDHVRFILPLGDVGELSVIPVGVVGAASTNDRANFVRFVGQSNANAFGMRGDHLTRRHGAVLALDSLGPADVRAYAFYTDIGALSAFYDRDNPRGTGADISYQGRAGNFSDNDWVVHAGLRGAASFGMLSPFASLDLSRGIDRKALVARDVDTNGLAVMAGLRLNSVDPEAPEEGGVTSELSFYQAQGPSYANDGLQSSHGYVGMKAQQTGGLLANRYLGWHPSAYAADSGVSDNPHSKPRKSGTRVLQAGATMQLPSGPWFGARYWFFQDTGVSAVDQDALGQLQMPYGYSRREVAAQARLGKTLGQEINLDLGYALSEHFQVYSVGGVLLPGEFYAIEVDQVVGDQLGGQQTAWAASAGTRINF